MGKRKRIRKSARVASDLMFAPAVIAMRLPLMGAPGGSGEADRAVAEKAAAWGQGMVAAQVSLAQSALGFWPAVLAGRSPFEVGAQAMERATNAAMQPSSRKVRSNFRRLSKP